MEDIAILIELVDDELKRVHPPYTIREECRAEAYLDIVVKVRAETLVEARIRELTRRACWRIMYREREYARRFCYLLDTSDYQAPYLSVEELVIFRDEIRKVMRDYEAQRSIAATWRERTGDISLYFLLRQHPGHGCYPDWVAADNELRGGFNG